LRRATAVVIVLADGSAGGRVTDNVHEDLVQDWQPLRDVAAPVVHALKSGGPRSKTMRFRFRLAESSGGAIVDLDFSYRSGNGATEGHATQPFKGTRSGHVYVIAFPWGAGKRRAGGVPLLRPGDRRVGERREAQLRLVPLPADDEDEAPLGERRERR
jgi:hypothetical protein